MKPTKHPQFEHLIEKAQERVAEKGNSADLPDIMLAGFGYMVDELRPRPNKTMRYVLTVAAVAGAIFAGMMKTLTERF